MAEPREWTLMFYFASDNPLAPGIVSQLKAIKNAGYHHEANIIAYFDPQPAGTPSHIFDVNLIQKLQNPKPNIGFGANDPFVRNLMLDKLWGDELGRDKRTPIRELIQRHAVDPGVIYNPPKPPREEPTEPPSTSPSCDDGAENDDPSETGPKESLQAFLRFCAREYKAKHYMLFILGHGVVVGGDVFLHDEHAAKHSITLRDLGEVLEDFKSKICDAEFELLGFHSCSMSSLEVAYELQDTAKYMLASQGPAFVGSWPYRSILIRLFNDLERQATSGNEIDVPDMLENIYAYILHNSTDFILAGYSFDLTLCDLRIITDVRKPIKDLSDALIEGLTKSMVKNCIQLAHLKSQSYWQESHTDLYDFCYCLRKSCQEFSEAIGSNELFQDLYEKCGKVLEALEKEHEHPVMLAEYAGPDTQYSHGLSVFFPWARPVEDRAIMQEYERYKFKSTGWFHFLEAYWGPQDGEGIGNSTMRKSRKSEMVEDGYSLPPETPYDELLEDIASLMFNVEGALNTNGALSDDPPVKTHPADPTGDECSCASIKNYLRDTRARRERGRIATSFIPFSSKASRFFM